MNKIFIALLLLLGCTLTALGAKPHLTLLPKPQQIKLGTGSLHLSGIRLEADILEDEYRAFLEDINVPEGKHYSHRLRVRLVSIILGVPYGQNEAYTLLVSSQGIRITAITPTGAYRALSTLRQLWQGGQTLPQLTITDYPAWQVRGVMHDVGRTFIPLAELKRQISLLAQFKINTFHWHLTENQAWRLESRAYPQLTSAESMMRDKGRYYTLSEAKELAEWCKHHHMLLIPEIDMPGHSEAFERAMGYDMQTPQGKTALKVILDEVMEAMDVPYIHLGTDEVEFTDPTFVPEMVAYVRSKGRKAISWNPGWDYKPGEIDLLQLWSYRGTPLKGTPAIDCRLHYTNHFDTFADLIALYHAQPLKRPNGGNEPSGAIIALWNDRYLTTHEQITADNHLWATALALAERTWLGGGAGYFDGHTTMLYNRQDSLYKHFADFEARLLHHKATTLSHELIPYVKQTHAVWQIVGQFPNGGDLSQSFAPEQTLTDDLRGTITPPDSLVSFTHQGRLYKAVQRLGSGLYLRHVWGPGTVPGVLAEPKEHHTAYALAWVYAPEAMDAGLYAETQNYSRSERDLPPPQGAWDYKGSRLWLNGEAIEPPKWTAMHTTPSNETPLGNENASSRPPIPIKLRKGWNKFLVKLPVGRFTSPQVRLVKWHFSLAVTTPDGKEALPISYHYLPTS